MQAQREKEHAKKSNASCLHPLEYVIGWGFLLIGSLGFIFFHNFFTAPYWESAYLPLFGLFTGLTLGALSGLSLLCRLRRAALLLLYLTGFIALGLFGVLTYAFWGWPNPRRSFDFAVLGVIVFSIFWAVWFVQQQERED